MYRVGQRVQLKSLHQLLQEGWVLDGGNLINPAALTKAYAIHGHMLQQLGKVVTVRTIEAGLFNTNGFTMIEDKSYRYPQALIKGLPTQRNLPDWF